MAWKKGLLASILTLACHVLAKPFDESINAQGSIGSHFGIPQVNASYDYVVIGGGTAGLAIATRLAQGGHSVAVIEAGSFYEFDNGNRSEVPAYLGNYLGSNPKVNNLGIDWGQYTTPQAGINNRKLLYSRGKTLGGSSARNMMVYQRGTKGSHAMWADEVGDDDYTWENFLPHFQRSVQFDPPNNRLRPANATPAYDAQSLTTNGGGPLRISFPNWANSWSSWAIRGLNELGLNGIKGFTAGNLIGWSYFTFAIDGETQTRSSSESSFLRQALSSLDQLYVYTHTLAQRILFDDRKRASGVLVSCNGASFTISANKEVILSAGAFRSPQLLMVSGVGPRSQLAAQSIPVVAERPGVGQNMWDHLLWAVSYPVDLITHSALGNNAGFLTQQINDYNTQRTGQLTNTAVDLLAWEKLPKANREKLSKATQDGLAKYPADWPEIELVFDDSKYASVDDLSAVPSDGKNWVAISAAVMTPFSRGNVTIASTDTSINPIISPNYLEDPRDQDLAVQGFLRARAVFETRAVRPILAGPEGYPGLNTTSYGAILEHIRNNCLEVYHASSTCKMGKTSDPMAVVDSKANVIGVSQLRVVDASALPFLPPGHPQATIYALAEKIACDILEGKGCAPKPNRRRK